MIWKAVDENDNVSRKATKSKVKSKAKTEIKTDSNKENKDRIDDVSEALYYDLALAADKVLGAAPNFNGGLGFRIKLRDSNESTMVPAKVAHKACPQLVIAFYEAHVVFDWMLKPIVWVFLFSSFISLYQFVLNF